MRTRIYFFICLCIQMNFKNNAVSVPKKPLFPGSGNDYMTSPQKRSVSFLTLFIVVVCTLIIALLVFKNFDRISTRFSSSIESTTWFDIGQDVSLSWVLQSDGDLISYTHTLTMIDATVVGLKSRTLDLSTYSGQVDIQWIVEKELNDMFIIEVNAISWALASTWSTWTVLGSGSGLYFPQAGIYLPAEFGQKYAVLNQGEWGILKVQNLSNSQIILISYFVCKASDPNKNCSQLKQNIWASAEKTVSSNRGDKLYKLEWVTSWFFSNGNYYGYFINDVADQEVIDLVDAMILPTETYVKDSLSSKMQSLCTDGSTSLMQVQNQTFSMDLNGLVVTLQWPTADGSASCKIFVDPSQAAWWTKISYISNTPTAASSTTTTSTTTVSDLDTSVKQFPINLDKAITFSSSRGYSIIFPSSNISYESVNVDDTLDLPGVRCSAQMDVTKYADKATLHDDPKVKIFTCSIKGTLNNLWNSIIQKESANGTKFLIQIMDSARMDFATNIAIQ